MILHTLKGRESKITKGLSSRFVLNVEIELFIHFLDVDTLRAILVSIHKNLRTVRAGGGGTSPSRSNESAHL